MRLIYKLYSIKVSLLEKIGMPLVILTLRLWLAAIFGSSGIVKISSWQATMSLFANEYKIPYLSAEVAAYSTTSIELLCSALLIIGLAARLATLPLLLLVAVIQLTYLNMSDHCYWAIMLCTILCYGAGPISVDYFIRRASITRATPGKL